jgi:hypothetical protein
MPSTDTSIGATGAATSLGFVPAQYDSGMGAEFDAPQAYPLTVTASALKHGP